jgi:acyl dehydratase
VSLQIENIAPGFQIPRWTREGTLDAWNRFAAVDGVFSGHHMDDEVGQHEGFSSAFISAPNTHAYLHAMLRSWLEGEGRIVSVDMRLKNPLLRGRTLEAGGEVTAVHEEGDETFVDLDIWQVDDQGTQLGVGTATVAVPVRHLGGLT